MPVTNSTGTGFPRRLVDSYAAFQQAIANRTPLGDLMAQGNHPNINGYRLIADLLFAFFEK